MLHNQPNLDFDLVSRLLSGFPGLRCVAMRRVEAAQKGPEVLTNAAGPSALSQQGCSDRAPPRLAHERTFKERPRYRPRDRASHVHVRGGRQRFGGGGDGFLHGIALDAATRRAVPPVHLTAAHLAQSAADRPVSQAAGAFYTK
jgi:hypothetical protein